MNPDLKERRSNHRRRRLFPCFDFFFCFSFVKLIACFRCFVTAGRKEWQDLKKKKVLKYVSKLKQEKRHMFEIKGKKLTDNLTVATPVGHWQNRIAKNPRIFCFSLCILHFFHSFWFFPLRSWKRPFKMTTTQRGAGAGGGGAQLLFQGGTTSMKVITLKWQKMEMVGKVVEASKKKINYKKGNKKST